MGDEQSGTGGAGAGGKGKPKKPKPPRLPDDAPQDVKDFVDCKGDSLELRPGELKWLPVPDFAKAAGAPTATFEAGTAAGSIKVTLSWTIISLKVTVSVRDGKLDVDTTEIPEFTGLGPKIKKWADDLNAWLAHNKKKLGAATLRDGKVTLSKVAETAMAPVPEKERAGAPALFAAGALTVGGLALGIGLMDAGDTTTVEQVCVANCSTGDLGANDPDTEATVGNDDTDDDETEVPPADGGSDTGEPAAPPPAEVHDGAFCLTHGAGSSVFSFAWTMPPAYDGPYTVALASGPTGPLSGAGTVTSGNGTADIQIFQYGPYDGLTITGPDGQVIPLGPLGTAFPYTVGPTPIDCGNLQGLEPAPVALAGPTGDATAGSGDEGDTGNGSTGNGSTGNGSTGGGGTAGAGEVVPLPVMVQTTETTDVPPWSLLLIPAGAFSGAGIL
jgi:hypothetical protein